jgi:FixJ family two-component response regulator
MPTASPNHSELPADGYLFKPACSERGEALVLVFNSDPATGSWILGTACSAGFRTELMDSAESLLTTIAPDLAVCAVLESTLPDERVFELQHQLAQLGVSVVFLTRSPSVSACARALKGGAVDFLTVPCSPTNVERALRDACDEAVARRDRRMQLAGLRSRYAELTRRERDVFALVVSGLLNKQVAHRLGISSITVQIHRGRVMRKMAARSFASLVRMADVLIPEAVLAATPAAND